MTGWLFFLAFAVTVTVASGEVHIKAAAAAYLEAQQAIADKQYARATSKLEETIRIEPTFMGAYQALIEAQIKSGDREGAAATATKLLQIEPSLNSDRLLLAQILLDGNEAERALAQFSFVLANDPRNADALAGFAAVAQKSGMKDRAAEALARGRKLYPQDKRFRADPSLTK